MQQIRAHFSQVANAFLHNDIKEAYAEELQILTLLFTTIFTLIICWNPSVYYMFQGFFFLALLHLLQVAVL